MSGVCRVAFTAGFQLFRGVGTGRLEQAVAPFGAPGLRKDQRFLDQRREDVEHVGLRELRGTTHRNRTVQGEAAGEHAEPAQQSAFALIEQFVAPVDERA